MESIRNPSASGAIDALITKYAMALEAKLLAWRRDIHKHPELGNQEFRTSKIVADHLRAIGVDEVYDKIAGGTGVMGIMRGALAGPTVGLRADMDALPIKEELLVPFASTATGEWGDQGTVPIMHACGHDAHTSMLMAAAEMIVNLRPQLKGRVMLIFQPAEEGCASHWIGKSGAARFVDEEIYLENLPDAVFGIHVNNDCPKGSAGKVGCLPGPSSYYMDIFRITVHGKGAHGYSPWLGTDALVAAARVLLALQTLPSRNTDVFNNAVTVSVGAMRGGHKFNVIADTATLDGALRFTDRSSKEYLEQRLTELVEYTAKSAGCTANLKMTWIPCIYNDPALLEKMTPCMKIALGSDNFVLSKEFAMKGLDDFSFYTERTPGLFFGLSIARDEEDPLEAVAIHDSKFVINEKALIIGAKAMASAALHFAWQD